MKKTLIQNAFQSSLGLLAISLAMMSCQKETTEIATITDAKDQIVEESARTASTATVSLKMTVNNSAGYNITSDGIGDYVNGNQNISLYFSTSGNLQFSNSASRSKPVTRWLNVNLNSPRPGSIARGFLQCGFISTLSSTISPNPTLLQNLVKGDTKCITLSAGVPGGVINFHNRSYEDTPESQSSYVYVTRISATPGDLTNQWLMTPVLPASGGCSILSSIAAFRNLADLYGYYNMPFSFTLTQIP